MMPAKKRTATKKEEQAPEPKAPETGEQVQKEPDGVHLAVVTTQDNGTLVFPRNTGDTRPSEILWYLEEALKNFRKVNKLPPYDA